jgi:AbrB family looped-hinge helix DNA binding protein
MPLVKIKHKGQMTIPAEIRDRLQLHQGGLLEATTDGRSIILTPKALVDREALKGGEERKSSEIHK